MVEANGSPPIESLLAAGAVQAVVDLDVISVTGADSIDYLQGQLSQNVMALEVGDTRWTLLLAPQGKVDAWMRIHRAGPDLLWLVVDAGFGETALARLERFKLRVDVNFGLERRQALALRGAQAHAVAEALDLGDRVPVGADWGGIAGVDIMGEPGDWADTGSGADDVVVAVDAAGLDLVRILQGRPLMGHELDESTIPAAAGVVDSSVDFTKGCYVGQELVARIDSRGSNTPTRLVRLSAEQGATTSTPTPLVVGDAEGGVVTSLATTDDGGVVGLVYVKRSVEVPGRGAYRTADGSTISVDLEPLR